MKINPGHIIPLCEESLVKHVKLPTISAGLANTFYITDCNLTKMKAMVEVIAQVNRIYDIELPYW